MKITRGEGMNWKKKNVWGKLNFILRVLCLVAVVIALIKGEWSAVFGMFFVWGVLLILEDIDRVGHRK